MAEMLIQAKRKHFVLVSLIEQTIRILDPFETMEVKAITDPQRLCQEPSRHVGYADIANFALMDQIIQSVQGFFERRVWVRGMDDIQIQVVNTETAKASSRVATLPKSAGTLPIPPKLPQPSAMAEILSPVRPKFT
jgi:hypothetical protein